MKGAAAYQRHLVLGAACVGLALGGVDREWWPAAALAAAAVVAWVAGGRAALLAALAVAGGVGVGAARVAAIDAPAARVRDGQALRARVELQTHPRPGKFGQSAEVRVADGAARGARLVARFSGEARPPRAIGSVAFVSGVVRIPLRRPGDTFDYAAYLRRTGLSGELRVTAARTVAPSRDGPLGILDRARSRAEGAIESGLDPAAAALVRGMVLGQDEAIDPGVRQDFRDSGLAHVLAVSGQNVMLLGALVLALLGFARVSPGIRIAATIALIALYVPLAGAGPSLQRAGVMGCAALVAVALARRPSRWYALLLAAAVTLALDPRAWTAPGWQLSFAAVAGILVLGPGLRKALDGLPGPLAEGIALTLAATIATAPLVAHHFGAVSLAGLPANVAGLPLVAPIMWLGMVDIALAQGEAIGGPFAFLAERGTAGVAIVLGPAAEALSAVAAGFADLPGATAAVPLGSAAGMTASYALLGGCAFGARRAWTRTTVARETIAGTWRRAPVRRRGAVMAAVAAVLGLGVARVVAGPAPPDRLTVSFLDVGQGDATLIQDGRGTNVLFDGGPPEGQVVRRLRRAGVRRLDVVVMTHQSRDHHGGLLAVVRRFRVGLLLDGGDGTRDPTFLRVVEEATRRGARRVPIVAPLALTAGALRIRFLSPGPRPPGPVPEDPNPRAAVAVVSAGDFDLFLSADAEPPALLGLDLPDVDAMKEPHHGSSDPGLPALLARLRPEMASIPVGKDNDYGHPAPSTLAALRRAGVPTWRNDRNGTVRVTVEAGRLSVRSERGGPVGPGP